MDNKTNKFEDGIEIIDDITELNEKNDEQEVSVAASEAASDGVVKLQSEGTGDFEIPIIEEPLQGDDKTIETISTAEPTDSNVTKPQTAKEEEAISIAKSDSKEASDKKGMTFIIVLFAILVIFIFALPYIADMVKAITG